MRAYAVGSLLVVLSGVACTDEAAPNPCGNGMIDPGETCDGDCPTACDDGVACTLDGLQGSASACNAVCQHTAIVACVADDGCCPAGCNSLTDGDCSPTCGNGQVEAGETCDGTCPVECNDGNACTSDQLAGGASSCSAACSHALLTACQDGDGCCPAGCSVASDSDCSPFCGDGVLGEGETCDGDCPTACDDGVACTIDTLTGSAAVCSAACSAQIITECGDGDGCCPPGCNATTDDDCSPTCGNLIVEPGEICDGDCPTSCDDRLACTIDTLTGSAATCSSSCSTQVITQCAGGDGCCPPGCNAVSDGDCSPTCGNGVIEPGETCEGTCPTACSDGDPCTSDVLSGSAASCSSACAYPPITQCAAGDACCPTGCVSSTDADCMPGSSPLGGACVSGADCMSLACLDERSYGWDDGACVLSCMSAAECGTGNHCRNGICLRGCNASGECRQPEYECWPLLPAGGVCAPAAGTGAIGDACVTTDQCPGGPDGFCATEAAFGWGGGYCFGLCGAAPCPAGSNCAGQACLDDCTADGACRTGYACADVDMNGTRECVWAPMP